MTERRYRCDDCGRPHARITSQPPDPVVTCPYCGSDHVTATTTEKDTPA